MSNLFSVFDPCATMGLPLNWMSMILVIMVIPGGFWITRSHLLTFIHQMISSVYQEFVAISGVSMTPGGLHLMISLFMFVGLNNIFGLVPYIFTTTSHLVFTASVALPLWLGHVCMAWLKTPQSSLAHLVPVGTPGVLMPFMVLIELTSNVIRPLTLSVRLAANMVAGHLLLTLLSTNAPSSTLMVVTTMLMALTLLCVLETAVAMIQAYVFSVLSTLYVSEVDSVTLS